MAAVVVLVLAGIVLEVLVGIHREGTVREILVQVEDTNPVGHHTALEGMDQVDRHDPNLLVVEVVEGRSFQGTVGSGIGCAYQEVPKDVVAVGLGSGSAMVEELRIVVLEVDGHSVTQQMWSAFCSDR